MKKSRNRIIKVASVYTGTVLGAGFASGREIIQFFTSYGWDGICGLFLSGLLFALLGCVVLEIVYIYKIKDYRDFIYPIMGDFLGNVMEWVVSLFMFITFCAMLAGAGALLKQQFNIPTTIGVFIMAGLCFIIFLYDIKGIIAINSILAPLLLIGGILLGIYIIVFKDVAVFSYSITSVFRKITRNWVASSIIYVSYNIITAVVILCSLYNTINSKKEARLGGIIGGLVLGVLGICIGMVTFIHYGNIKDIEIPMLEITAKYGFLIEYIYLIVLFSAIFTTAVANGYGFLNRVCFEFNVSYKFILPIFILISILIAKIGFSKMVGEIYPIFGYVGIFEIFVILLYFVNIKIRKI
ncbi:YkvI family membrane protein [Defluviitalea phaphyphila]|uniref:YkvI family membrane protein n=1 Tax=Defluviitalea phaphyphila TaxID=1473580 RepID=UPI0007300551|nr:hypothetical protein [Defluviitalea phaphyphila]